MRNLPNGLILAVLVSFTVFVTAAGCTVVGSALDRSSDKIADGVDKYCAETDENFRTNLRTAVNSKTNGATIVITCP